MRYKAIVSFRAMGDDGSSLYTLYLGDESKVRFFVPFAIGMFGKDPYVSGFSESLIYPADTKWDEIDYSTVMRFSGEDSQGLYKLAVWGLLRNARRHHMDSQGMRPILEDSAYVIKTNTDEFIKWADGK